MTTQASFLSTRDAIKFTDYPTMRPVWFVNSTNTAASNASGYGSTHSSPFATLAYAVTIAGVGDTIFVADQHTEAFSAAAAMTIATNGLQIIGLGSGNYRPTFTWGTSTAAQVVISAANIYITNCIFDFTGIDAVVAGFSVTGADVWFDKCKLVTNSATTGVIRGILTAATATRFKVTGCHSIGVKTNSGTTTTAVISHEVGEDFEISGCHFEGKMTQAILNASTILSGLINNCTFHIFTGTKAVSVAAATQAFLTNCNMIVASGTAPVVGTVLNVANNKYSTEGLGITAGSALAF